ncbi:uncharacterized protein L969DRAFT_14303 [Mixia osmundae IAM 14324]|uniref:uncharacterized protein n=1 Tax=Mixia osmundae (strain CBS 9802 / IAM 14324 / JCM 22182 / KY 12970) TaxID=764103 RepID=UPI0004A54790|nr:uncharacterized protein L969DRAFT_14303 [Mixia osmundae IAM 14324]KEI42097.1 hypothetical protein L969DRAFT_14303 [Mixia osmundae IAM 14324]
MSKEFSFEELSAKKSKDDLHLLIHGKVYSVAKFLDEHPGGDEVLLGEGGRDATEAFEDVGHSDEARKLLEDFVVGTCKEGAAEGPASPKASAKSAGGTMPTPEGFTYLIPLGFLFAYLAWRFTLA